MPYHLFSLPKTPNALFLYIAVLIVQLCVTAIFVAILINFIEAKHNGQVAREQRSPVATGSMIAFFVGYYYLVHHRIGVVTLPSQPLQVALIVLGLVVMVVGCVVNILGRLRLGRNWANQVTIYAEQTLVTHGVYGLVRHPLYASLIWMFYAGGLIYLNYAALLVNTFFFIPAMYYRAKLEERYLAQQFSAYADYQQRVGMFFPRFQGKSDAVV